MIGPIDVIKYMKCQQVGQVKNEFHVKGIIVLLTKM